MSLPPVSTFVLDFAQAATVAAPGKGLPRWLPRPRSKAWALVLPGSLVGVVVGIELLPDAAEALSWLALFAVPPLAAAALGWADRRTIHLALAVLLAAGLLAVATFATEGARITQACGTALTALSCVTLARLLVAVAPATAVKVGLVVMAVIDAWLVFSSQIDTSADLLNSAIPAAGLPRLQTGYFGGSSLGYGDFFVAATFGALLAAADRPQGRAAIEVLIALVLFDLLFLLFDRLPATVPVAVVLCLHEARTMRRT